MDATYRAEFSLGETHGFSDPATCAVSKTSAGLGWANTFMSVQEEGPYRNLFTARPDIFIIVVNYGFLKGRFSVDGREYIVEGAPGTVSIVPDRIEFNLDLASTVGTTRLYLKRGLLDQVARNIYDQEAQQMDLIFRPSIHDPVLEQLCNAIREVLDDPSSTSMLYVDHMSHAIAAYLLKRHSNVNWRLGVPSTNGKLSAKQLRRTRELIEARLGERLTLADIAVESGIGADHFGRLFKQETGLTLYQFVIKCRVDRARHLLIDTPTPIIDIAQECGFADQVHLTRAFRRIVGTTPAVYRKEKQS